MFRRAVAPVVVIAAMFAPDPGREPMQPSRSCNSRCSPATCRPRQARTAQSPRLLDTDTCRVVRGVRRARRRKGRITGTHWPISGTSKTLERLDTPGNGMSTGEVYQAPDESGAKRLFELGKRPLDKSRLGVGFASYGSFGRRKSKESRPAVVRRRAVRPRGQSTRQTEPGRDGVRPQRQRSSGRCSSRPLRSQFKPTEAQMVAVLETYAAKQKSRVGTG